MPTIRTTHEGLAYAIWEWAWESRAWESSGRRGSLPHPVPPAATDAARDLEKLYLEVNHARSLASIVDKFMLPSGDRGEAGYVMGRVALRLRLGGRDKMIARAIREYIKVPSFEIEFDGKTLTWEGDADRANPDDFDVPGVTTNPGSFRVEFNSDFEWQNVGMFEAASKEDAIAKAKAAAKRKGWSMPSGTKWRASPATDNPRGIFTDKGERMYEEIKAGYGSDPRAGEIAARTVYARAKEGVPGLLRVGKGRPPGVPNRGR